jgi:hypothetical protein
MEACLIVIAVIAAFYGINVYQKKVAAARRLVLMRKYNNSEIVEKIMNKWVWQGQDNEQLKDSLGNPEFVDVNVMKSKRKEIWKYYRRGANRYGLKITLENDVVVGWDKK